MTFNDIFKSSFLESITEFSAADTLIAMVAALVIGMFIFVVYKKTFNSVMYSTGFAMTLVGMTMVTTLVILAVTSNVVLSLGMVGALSIVRFRAAIKEPMEIVYLFWAVAAGIVIGAGMLPLAVIGSAIIGVILILFANKKIHDNPYLLILNCQDENAENTALSLMKEAVKKHAVKSKTVNAQGIEFTAEIRMKDGETAFVNRLNEIAGVENATLERQDAKTIPIIAMTANAFREDAEKCMEAGMNAHLAKPLDAEKMIVALKKCMADNSDVKLHEDL